ncbi:MAG: polysaccharide pyruvyl transferase family protein, partial [Tannerella sp.]|nr:polysaccharide pyruvyl transferase family protein [Tannerella sp.]
MKIGILTFHACYNYGACLQAYALQQTVRKEHPDCEIIDYQSDNFININHPFARYPAHWKEVIKNITRLPYWKQLKQRGIYFDKFITQALVLSQRCATDESVRCIAEKYDCIICGSDQIWNLNPAIRYETPLYYLNFPKKQRRVAYATSFGSWVNDFESRSTELTPWIRTFDSLSMRETSGVKLLRSKGFTCELVLDPTLLLQRVEYDNIAKERLIDDPYILLFSWEGTKEAVELTKIAAKKLGCRALFIVPPPRAMFCGIERKLDVGPEEFLSLVKHAEFVVTDSFHGTVFSTIYRKPFASVIKDKADARRVSLMEQFGLVDHLVNVNTINWDKIFQTDFDQVELKIKLLRN